VVTVPRLPALDFSIGFDDFVLRPLVPAELYARLRQLDWRGASFGSEEVIKIGDLVIDVPGYEATWQGRKLGFTHQEFELLRFLAQHRGKVLSRDQLLGLSRLHNDEVYDRSVDVQVGRLRKKIHAKLITTERGAGYVFTATVDIVR
jgi:DNA-binding response OmpR family regulator